MSAGAAVLFAAAALAAPGAGSAAARLRGPAAASRGRAQRARHREVTDPMAIAAGFDLLAACLQAGMPVAVAAEAVAVSAPEPLGSALDSAANLLTLGAEPEIAWERAAAHSETDGLARMARRSSRSGAAFAAAVTELAAQRRLALEDRAVAAAERAGVLISGPLGLCFLPAFLCLGIVPVVVGLATRVLSGGVL
ncbi:type II secretion system F family protein [Rhodococcus sp. UNC363MFTsu5.1]|uniref:type II secretion system F family protein n=1 Tax=Rhodococcus sp. UNC363MFTsu5.1 TaxID=1449069 RepID=UPI0004863CC4|nr:type II secretion system F family protein [Rhodococcus sp. UNC363MFTsu5.1]